MTDVMTVRVRYRLAKHVLSDDPDKLHESQETLEQQIRNLLSGKLGSDVNGRLLPTIEDERHSLCLHFSSVKEGAVIFDLLHLDDRTEFSTWKKPAGTVPISTLSGTKIPGDEMSLQEPAYLLVSKNHVAVIERVGLRTPAIEAYLNQLLEKDGKIDSNKAFWKLVPKIENLGIEKLKGGVEKIILKPHAALAGEAQSTIDKPIRRSRARKIDEYIGYGEKILQMLQIFGAHDSDIEGLRKKMSSDLVLKAKVEISVSKAERSTEAKVSADDIQKAFAHLADHSDVNVVDKDGKSNGKLTQLSHPVEVKHKDGIIDADSAANALVAGMTSWAAKGAIEL